MQKSDGKMSLKIRRAAVLGSGVMGSQIAALLATLGVRVHLLDLVTEDPTTETASHKKSASLRSQIAIKARDILLSTSPSPLFSEKDLDLIIPGNFEDDMAVISEVDWVIEAVTEKIDIKHSIHRRIQEYIKPTVPVTTNTSGISLAEICRDFPNEYQQMFFGTHFFNPPRAMHLLEFIPTTMVDMRVFNDLKDWCEDRLGKGVIIARDTVNFIANRIGVFNIQAAIHHMTTQNLSIEEVDLLTGRLVGRPGSATFKTLDIVGIDTFALVAQNVYSRAPSDPYRNVFLMPSWVQNLINSGRHGHKTDHKGFYSKQIDQPGDKPQTLVYCSERDNYAPPSTREIPWLAEAQKITTVGERLKFIFGQNDKFAQFVWLILRDTFSYAALLAEEIADGDILSIDQGMRWGFNWKLGPFALWQAIGFDYIYERMLFEKTPRPHWLKAQIKFYEPHPDESLEPDLHIEELKSFDCRSEKLSAPKQKKTWVSLPKNQNSRDARVLISNESASLLDIGDEIACVVFHSKMNTLKSDSLEIIQKSVAMVGKHFQGLVVANYGPCFSSGADLQVISQLIAKNKLSTLEKMIREFQGTFSLLKYAPFPIVACPHGLTLGGGCELILHTQFHVAYGELSAGLVEPGVGLIPAGGGTKELALKAYALSNQGLHSDPLPFLKKALVLMLGATPSTSAKYAEASGLLPRATPISLSKKHLITTAKKIIHHAVQMNYMAPQIAPAVRALGRDGQNHLRSFLQENKQLLKLSPYDLFIGEQLAYVLCGGDVKENTFLYEHDFLALERRAFLNLCERPETQERIKYMLQVGKPLKN